MLRCKNIWNAFAVFLRKKQKQEIPAFEHCIICNRVTPIRKDTPIEKRNYYESGAGQLCRQCYEKFNG